METLVAISLLLLAITGPMVFAQNGLRAAFQSRDQVTAFYLAQDAIEFVKNRRDHNILARDSEEWIRSFNGYDGADCAATDAEREGGCSFDTSTPEGDIHECSLDGSETGCLGDKTDGTDDRHLKIDEDGIFGHGPGTDSIFSRTVYVDETILGEARVTVIVRWRSHENLGVREIEVVEYIRNWASALGV